MHHGSINGGTNGGMNVGGISSVSTGIQLSSSHVSGAHGGTLHHTSSAHLHHHQHQAGISASSGGSASIRSAV
jgi:hypothetical protein